MRLITINNNIEFFQSNEINNNISNYLWRNTKG